MRSFTDRTGVSIAAGRVGAGVFVIVVADLISRTAAVGWAVRRTGCVCSFRRVCSIGRHPFEELGRLEAMVRVLQIASTAPPSWGEASFGLRPVRCSRCSNDGHMGVSLFPGSLNRSGT